MPYVPFWGAQRLNSPALRGFIAQRPVEWWVGRFQVERLRKKTAWARCSPSNAMSRHEWLTPLPLHINLPPIRGFTQTYSTVACEARWTGVVESACHGVPPISEERSAHVAFWFSDNLPSKRFPVRESDIQFVMLHRLFVRHRNSLPWSSDHSLHCTSTCSK